MREPVKLCILLSLFLTLSFVAMADIYVIAGGSGYSPLGRELCIKIIILLALWLHAAPYIQKKLYPSEFTTFSITIYKTNFKIRSFIVRKYLKLSLLLSLFLAIFSFAFAKIVTVEEGNAFQSEFPLRNYFDYSYVQQIYTQSQIEHAGVIEKIRFYFHGGNIEYDKDWTIYMGHTSKESFDSVSLELIPLSELTEVYSGDVSPYTPAALNWMEIPLDNVFDYNNTDNLVIAVKETTTGYSLLTWGSFTSGANTAIYYNHYGSEIDIENQSVGYGTKNYINRIQLVFESDITPQAPVLLAPANNATEQYVPIFSWQANTDGEDPSGYDLYLGTDPNPPLIAENLIVTSYQAFNLDFDEDYYWKVVAKNNVGESPNPEMRMFSTRSDPTITSLPHMETFNDQWRGSPAAPDGWRVVNVGNTTHTWERSNSLAWNAPSPSFTAFVENSKNDYLISPPISLSDDTYRLKWWDKVVYTQSPNSYKVLISRTDTQITSFTEVLADIECNTIDWTLRDIILDGSEYNAPIYIAFYLYENYFLSHGLGIDDFSIEEFSLTPMPVVEPDSHDFGEVVIDATISKSIMVSNRGGGELIITAIDVSGDGVFALDELPEFPVTLATDQFINFDAIFAPTEVGSFSATITITGELDGPAIAYAGLQRPGSTFTHIVTLTGSCVDSTIREFPYTENFDSVEEPEIPVGWTVLNPDNEYTYWETSSYYPNSGLNSMHIGYTQWGDGPLNDWFITPPIAMEEGKEYSISFSYRALSTDYYEKLGLYFGSAPTESGMTDELWCDEGFDHEEYGYVQETVTPSADGNYYFGWQAYSEEWQWGMFIDDIKIEELSSTPVFAIEPSIIDFGEMMVNTMDGKLVTISNAGGGELTITDIELSGNDAFELVIFHDPLPITLGRDEFYPFGVMFTPTDLGDYSATISITDDQAIAWAGFHRPANTSSRNVHTIEVTGSCIDPTITEFPYTENFDSTEEYDLPLGWTQLNPDNEYVYWVTRDFNSKSAPNSMFIDYSYIGEGPLNNWLISPPVTMEAGKHYRISFYYRAYDSSCTENLGLYFGSEPTEAGMTQSLWYDEGFSHETYTLVEETVSPTVDGNYFFGWHAYSDEYQYGIHVDDISIEVLPNMISGRFSTTSWDLEDVVISATGIAEDDIIYNAYTGEYIILVPSGYSGVVTPFKDEHIIEPEYREYNNVVADIYEQDYIIKKDLDPAVHITFPSYGQKFEWNEPTAITITWEPGEPEISITSINLKDKPLQAGSAAHGQRNRDDDPIQPDYYEINFGDDNWINVGQNTEYTTAPLGAGDYFFAVRGVLNTPQAKSYTKVNFTNSNAITQDTRGTGYVCPVEFSVVIYVAMPAVIDPVSTITITGDEFMGAIDITDPSNFSGFPNDKFVVEHYKQWEIVAFDDVNFKVSTAHDWLALKVGDDWEYYPGPLDNETIAITGITDIFTLEFVLGNGRDPATPIYYITGTISTVSWDLEDVVFFVDNIDDDDIEYDANTGKYTIIVPKGYSGEVMPIKNKHEMVPDRREYSNVIADMNEQDYVIKKDLKPYIAITYPEYGQVFEWYQPTAITITWEPAEDPYGFSSITLKDDLSKIGNASGECSDRDEEIIQPEYYEIKFGDGDWEAVGLETQLTTDPLDAGDYSFAVRGVIDGLTAKSYAKVNLVSSNIVAQETRGTGYDSYVNFSVVILEYAAEPDTPVDTGEDTTIIITGDGFIGATELPIEPEDLTPIPNASFVAFNHTVWQLVGTGEVTLTFYNDGTEDIWIAYLVGGIWIAQEIPAGESIPIIVNLDAKDASFEFVLGKGSNPTLPVELSSFSVALNSANSPMVSWTTESETGVSGFYIYRGMDVELDDASLISGLIDATNSSQTTKYKFIDENIYEHGIYYYWLSVIDFSGHGAYHGPIALDYSFEDEEDIIPEIPFVTRLTGAYPNPFNPETNIGFELAEQGEVFISIYNMRGQLVRSFASKEYEAGVWSISWNGKDNGGRDVSSGVYHIRMITGKKSFSSKAVLMK